MNSYKAVAIFAALFFTMVAAAQSKPTNSVTIVFRDQHQQTLSSSEVARIDLKSQSLVINHAGHEEQIPLSKVSRIEVNEASAANTTGRSSFVGKWRVGFDSNNPRSFQITLDRDGKARKSIDSGRGTWTYVDGEARITWDDGWHDVIAKVGDKYEKRAYAPGKSFTDKPTNVAEARRANDQSI